MVVASGGPVGIAQHRVHLLAGEIDIDADHARFGTRFDPVIDRVADQVDQGIDQTFYHPGIDFGVFPRRHQGHFLPRRPRHLACGAAEAGKGRPDGHHARPGDFIPHAERQLLQMAHVLVGPANRSAQLGHRLGDVCGDFADASRQDVEVVVFVELQAAEIAQTRHGRRSGSSAGL